MKYLVTSCCKEKRSEKKPIPASLRYLSDRIGFVLAEATRQKTPALIFSGRYGLLQPQTPIPYYDKALLGEEVEAVAQLANQQIEEWGITEMIFYAWPRETPGWEPYHACLERACRAAGIKYEYVSCTIPDRKTEEAT